MITAIRSLCFFMDVSPCVIERLLARLTKQKRTPMVSRVNVRFGDPPPELGAPWFFAWRTGGPYWSTGADAQRVRRRVPHWPLFLDFDYPGSRNSVTADA